MIRRIWDYRKVRFLCVGAFNAVVDLTILNVLVFGFHFPIWLGNSIAVSIAISMSYFLNHRIVFKHHHNPNLKQYLKFFLVTGVGIIITQTLIIYLTKASFYNLLHNEIPMFSSNVDTKLSLNIAKISAALFGMVWNYMLYSRLVFKKAAPIEEL